jgi:exonuclease III
MRIGTFNVRGLSGKADLVQKLFDDIDLDVIGLTETWMRPFDRFLLPLEYSAISLPQTGGLSRGRGGIALAYRPGMDISITLRVSTAKIQMIIAKTPKVSLVLLYISPSSSALELVDTLETARTSTTGPLVLMGDLNARNIRWDTNTNTKGTALLDFCERNRWTINASPTPSFSAHQGQSNVDLFISSYIEFVEKPWAPEGIWVGSSDHRPIIAEITVATTTRNTKRKRVAWWKRKDDATLQKVKDLVTEKTATLTEALKNASCKEELDSVVNEWAETVSSPFVTESAPKPRRYATFWNEHLDRLASKRTRLYKRASRLKTQEAWDAHKAVDDRIKKIVKRKKREGFLKFANGLQQTGIGPAQKTVNSIARIKKGYSAKHTAVGKTLDPTAMTDYLAETCKSPRPVQRYSPTFEVDCDMRKAIILAVCQAPASKAPGPDLVIGEALRSAPQVNGAFLAAGRDATKPPASFPYFC